MAMRLNRLALCLLAGFCTSAVTLASEIQSASAQGVETRTGSERVHKRTADANALVSSDSAGESKLASQATRRPGSAKGPYYVDFRARTAASWGHAFVWYGKTSERAVEVA